MCRSCCCQVIHWTLEIPCLKVSLTNPLSTCLNFLLLVVLTHELGDEALSSIMAIAPNSTGFLSLAKSTYILELYCAVRAGTGGDEAGIWAGDLVCTHDLASYLFLYNSA